VLGKHIPCHRRHLLQQAPSARTPRAASTSLSRGRPENLKYPAVLARSGRGTRRRRRQGKSWSPCSAVPRAFGEPGMPRRARAIRARHSTLTASTEITESSDTARYDRALLIRSAVLGGRSLGVRGARRRHSLHHRSLLTRPLVIRSAVLCGRSLGVRGARRRHLLPQRSLLVEQLFPKKKSQTPGNFSDSWRLSVEKRSCAPHAFAALASSGAVRLRSLLVASAWLLLARSLPARRLLSKMPRFFST
jgi:hypothetical protein